MTVMSKNWSILGAIIPVMVVALIGTAAAETDAQRDLQEFERGAPGAYCTDAGAPGLRPWRGAGGSSECPPWAACSVYVGDCNGREQRELPLFWSEPAPPPEGVWLQNVCSGVCAGGALTRFVISGGGLAKIGESTEWGGAFSAEVIPPVWRGHLGIRAQWWTNGTIVTGAALNFPVRRSLIVGLAGDFHLRAGRWGLGASGRIEYFPWHISPDFIPFQFLSVIVEGGAQSIMPIEDDPRGIITFGLRLWI